MLLLLASSSATVIPGAGPITMSAAADMSFGPPLAAPDRFVINHPRYISTMVMSDWSGTMLEQPYPGPFDIENTRDAKTIRDRFVNEGEFLAEE